MTQAAATLKQKLAAETGHFCHCWRLQQKNGNVIGLTNHDRDIMFRGVRYYADCGISVQAQEQSADLVRDGSEIRGVLGSPHLAEADLRKGLFDNADIELWLVDWRQPETALLLLRGRFGQVRCEGQIFHVTLQGPAGDLQQPIGRTFQSACDAMLGDSRCGLNLADAAQRYWQFTGTIIKADSLSITVAAIDELEADWFAHGQVDFLSGALQGSQGQIRSDKVLADGRRLTFWDALASTPASGDRVRLIVGCDKQFSTCCNKFSNSVNFRGMPHMPSDHLLVNAAG